MVTIKVTINQVVSAGLRGNRWRWDDIRETFSSIEDARDFLVKRYGKIPSGKRKVYVDRNINGKKQAVEVGFSHSYWNGDGLRHEDWVTIEEVTSKPLTLKCIR